MMASSLIRINEATVAELQRLKGIGPKRASYIHTFRQEVGPLTNTFDLAAAASISIRTANRISDQIDWYPEGRVNQVSFWPLIITSIASLWLLGLAYGQLLSRPKDLAELCFSTGIGLILSGALLAAADIALTSARQEVSETTHLFSIGITFCATGLLAMTGLTAIGLVANLPPDLATSLKQSMLFIFMALIIFWVMYGPAIALRWLVGRATPLLHRCKLAYEWSPLPLAIITAAILVLDQGVGRLEEVFAIWAIVVLTTNGLEMTRGKSAFTGALSNRDLARYQFLLSHQLASKPTANSRLIGVIYLANAATLVGLLLKSLIQL